MFFVISFLVLLLSGLSEQSLYNGSCSSYEFTAVRPFFPVTLNGRWYLIATDDVGLPFHDSDCIRFKHLRGPSTVLTKERAQQLSTKTTSNGISRMNFSGFNGNYVYEMGAVHSNTTIIFSDATTYVEVSCDDVGGQANIYVGIFYRAPQMPSLTRDEIYAFLENNKINTTQLRSVVQDDVDCGPF